MCWKKAATQYSSKQVTKIWGFPRTDSWDSNLPVYETVWFIYFLFVCGLFDDALSNAEYIYCRKWWTWGMWKEVTVTWWTWGMWKEVTEACFKALSGRNDENRKQLSHEIRCTGSSEPVTRKFPLDALLPEPVFAFRTVLYGMRLVSPVQNCTVSWSRILNVRYIWFEFVTAVTTKTTILWRVTPCSVVDRDRRFEEIATSMFRVKE